MCIGEQGMWGEERRGGDVKIEGDVEGYQEGEDVRS